MSELRFKKGDKVRLLDGSWVKDFCGNWVEEMDKDIGKVCTISFGIQSQSTGYEQYKFKEIDWGWDGRCLELVETNPENKGISGDPSIGDMLDYILKSFEKYEDDDETRIKDESVLGDFLDKISEITIRFK